jgi:hypothetical protein
MATLRPEQLTDEQRRVCRRLAKGDGPVAVYARMALALSAGRGLRLTFDDAWWVLVADESSSQALLQEIQHVLDGD